MKLLLKHSIRSLGRAGEVVDVKAGYARNYLLPQGKAIPATESNVALVEKKVDEAIRYYQIGIDISEKQNRFHKKMGRFYQNSHLSFRLTHTAYKYTI